MKVTEHIQKAQGETLFSLEILPPLKGQSMKDIITNLDPLMDFNPAFVDVTYHREEVVYDELPNGLLQKRNVRKRPSTVAISTAIQHRYNVDAVPHLLAGGFNKDETENALIEMDFLGIENVLALRGDAAHGENYFKALPDGHAYAEGVVKQISDLNQAKYLDEKMENAHATNFCVGVAGYPEKHMESPNLETDLEYLKAKVDAGADYIVTQMFFDNKIYYSFVEKCRKAGITVPIIPGIKPINLKNQLTVLPKLFSIDLPFELASELSKCKNNEDARRVGTEWAIHQSKDLVANNAPSLHIYTYGISDNVGEIVKAAF